MLESASGISNIHNVISSMTSTSPKYIIFALAVLGLLGCNTQPAATVLRPNSFRNVALKNPYSVIVKQGDTIKTLAEKYHVSAQEIIALNHLKPPYHLNNNSVIRLPSPQYHIVQKGDTLFAIARSYNVSVSQLIAVNHLSDPEHILAGSKLKFTDQSHESESINTQTVAALPSSADSTASVKVAELAPLPESSLASKTSDGNAALSSEKPTAAIATTSNSTPAPASTLSDEEMEAATLQAVPAKQSPSALSEAARPKPASITSATTPASLPTSSSPVTDNATNNFIWPVQGKIISRFGPRKGGLYNDGINISAPEGSEVRAAADGTVVYSGNELRGYGNLLLIKHDNGYVTAYAHTSKNTASKDDIVHKGDVIAYVGKTGHVSSPQLHFSLRRDRKAVNPEKYLPVLLSKN